MDAEETEPTATAWEFAVVLKGNVDKSIVIIPRNRETALDPIRHLLELRDRIRQRKGETDCMEETGFWMKENGKRMSYDAIRSTCVRTMAAAGIRDTHGYHLKHAAITELERHGV